MARDGKRLPSLGELELSALAHLWAVEDADVLAMHEAVGLRRGITANTVGSALERLYRKRLVTREKVSHAYRYRAAIGRDAFAAQRMLDAAARGARTLTDSGLLSAFVDLVAEEDEASLDRLEALIARKRSGRGDP